jgi:hypothetical protein
MGANDGKAVVFCADGKVVARHGTAVFRDELCDSRLLVRGQFLDLLNDFKRTHGLIIRQNMFLASHIVLHPRIEEGCGWLCFLRAGRVMLGAREYGQAPFN